MQTDGHDFLARFASYPAHTFEGKFLRTSLRLGLGLAFKGAELNLLHRAAFIAALCNIAFNGRGGCGGEIKPERETTRIMLEQTFMAVRDEFFASTGWKVLPGSQQQFIQRQFLTVAVAEENLAV